MRLRDDDVIEVMVEKPAATPQGAQDTLMMNAATQLMLASYRFATIHIPEEDVMKIILAQKKHPPMFDIYSLIFFIVIG